VATLFLGSLFGYISQKAYNQLQELRKKQVLAQEKQQRGDNDRLRAIKNTLITASLSYKRVLDTALDLCVNALHVEEIDPGQKTAEMDAGFSTAVLSLTL